MKKYNYLYDAKYNTVVKNCGLLVLHILLFEFGVGLEFILILFRTLENSCPSGRSYEIAATLLMGLMSSVLWYVVVVICEKFNVSFL
jgi:hypothetical protein